MFAREACQMRVRPDDTGVSLREQARRHHTREGQQHSGTTLHWRHVPQQRVTAATAGRPLRPETTQPSSRRPSRRRSRVSAAAAATEGGRLSSRGATSDRQSRRRPSGWSPRPARSAGTRARRRSSRTCCQPRRRTPWPLPAYSSLPLRPNQHRQLSAGQSDISQGLPA